MAHLRKRHIDAHLRKLMDFSPIIGILGHRQAGKTTLMSELVNTYVTMDQRASNQAATNDPDGFIAKFVGLANGIDECQLVPDLFPALKERVRTDKRPGQFILTGSVRFTSRRAIRESLTGRIINLTLHPMVLSELLKLQEPQTLRYFLLHGVAQAQEYLNKHRVSSDVLKAATKVLSLYATTGGLPGICFIRDAGVRTQKLATQLETILDRDLRQITQTSLSYESLRRVLSALAFKNGLPFDWAELSRTTRVSTPTLRKLLPAFESLFLVNFLEAEGTERRQAVLFEDPGEASFLADGKLDELSLWSSTVLTHAKTLLDTPITGAQKHLCRFTQYRTRGGAFIPLVARSGSAALGIVPMLEENPTPQILGSAQSFLKNNQNASVICVHPHGRNQLLTKNILSISASRLFL